MIPLAASLYLMTNVALVGTPYEAWGVQILTREGCAALADKDHVCTPLHLPKRRK